MVKLGILPAFDGEYFKQTATLSFNDSGRFEDRWVWLAINGKSPCVFTKGLLKKSIFPVRHGEGKFMTKSAPILKRLHKQGQVVACYCTQDSDKPTMEYPANPNGAVDSIAGICNETGRLYGMMPHPEAYTHFHEPSPLDGGEDLPERRGWAWPSSRMQSSLSAAKSSSCDRGGNGRAGIRPVKRKKCYVSCGRRKCLSEKEKNPVCRPDPLRGAARQGKNQDMVTHPDGMRPRSSPFDKGGKRGDLDGTDRSQTE